MNDLKLGSVFKHEGEPYVVMRAEHVHMGRGGSTLRVKMRNLINGKVLERAYKQGDKIDEALVDSRKASFLYQDGSQAFFMDDENYEQFGFSVDVLGDKIKYLKDGQKAEILFFEERPVNVELPKKIALKVVSSPQAVKGNTASGNVTKMVVLETGYELQAPLFVKQGDEVVINTDTGEYVERVSADK